MSSSANPRTRHPHPLVNTSPTSLTSLISLPYPIYLPLFFLLLLPLPQGNVATEKLAKPQKPHTFYIGGVLSTSSNLNAFTMEAQIIDYEHLYLPANVSLYDSTQIMDSNPIKTAITVCNKLIKERVYAIIVSKPESGDLSPASVSYTAGFYHIPVLGISSRDSAFSDKNIHVSFLRTVPPYSHQADVWVELLKHFQYKQIVFIHSSDTDGRSLLGRFQTRAQDLEKDDQEVKVERVEEFEPGQDSYINVIQSLKECQARVFFLYATQRDAEKIFADAESENMTGTGYAWIVTEQALNSSNIPIGALGLQLTSSEDEQAHIHDALHVLAAALGKLYDSEDAIEEAPSNCNSSGSTWSTGRKLFKYIREQIFVNGSKTGRVAFDAMGDRLFAEYKIINVKPGPILSTVGNYYYSNASNNMVINVDDSEIIWPGGHSDCDKEEGWFNCPQYIFNSNSTKLTHLGSKFCCRGYCMDLLEQLANKCNFTYDVYLSLDSNYGSLERNNETGKQEWSGLIGELVSERADLIVAPLTINPERAQVMEFSKPFKYQGITILQKRQPRASQLVSFLQPFKPTLWVLVLVSVKVIAVCLYLLDRFSPFGRYSAVPGLPNDEESLNLTAAIWFAWGVLLNSGIGEGTPRSFSARVLGMVWAGFAMIIVASYTANLAAFLVLDKPQTSLTGINDPRLRNPMENFTYATVKGSSVDMYFRRQVELSNMYRTMEGKHFLNPELAIDAVRNGSLKAFIWDSSRLEYEAARDCNLITAGELFGRSGYGVGLQKGSPWADRITLAILDFHESGYMESLDNKWILNSDKDKSCNEKDNNSPATLGLENMRGVFILVAAGIVFGSGLILIEIIYHKHKMRKVKRSQAAKVAISRWKGTVERRRTLKEKQYKKEPLKANGSSSTGKPKLSSLSLSFENLTRGCGESSQWHKVTHLVRPRSTASGLCHSPSTPRFLRSLPSTEFRRLAAENAATAPCPASPITPLSVDFSKKRRRRPMSPDLLQRCSPERDKVTAGNVSGGERRSNDFSDYAPISTEGWIPPVDNIPAPPPPPRRRLKSVSHSAYIASSMGQGGGCAGSSSRIESSCHIGSSKTLDRERDRDRSGYSARTSSNSYIGMSATSGIGGSSTANLIGGSEVLCGSSGHSMGTSVGGSGVIMTSTGGSGYISKGSSTNSPPPPAPPPPAYTKYQTSRYSIRKEIV